MAGYSGTPLPRKLMIKPGHRVALVGAPADFERTLGELPAKTVLHRRRGRLPYDTALVFVRSRAELERRVRAWKDRIPPDGALWVAWPKRASGVPTDVTEDTVRAVALAEGLVDVKVCAVDETWSGLRLVYRLTDRPGLRRAGTRPPRRDRRQGP